MSIVDAIARGTMTTMVINTVGMLGRRSSVASDDFGSQARATGCRKLCHVLNFLLLLLAFSVVFRTIAIANVREVRRVLVLNDFDEIASPGIALLDQAIFTALNHSRYQIELYSESLEANLFTDEASQSRIRDGYIRKYEDRKPDLIIAVGPASLQFMVQSHEKFFPGVPIVFCGSSEDMLEKLKPDSSFTGVWGVVQPKETLTAALRLQPGTKHVVVVGGVGTYDRYLEEIVKQSLRNYESRLEFTYLTDLDMPTLLRRLGQLPSNTVVLYTSIFRDAAGTRFIDANQSSPAVINASNAPVFVLFDVNLGTGAVGGDIISFASDGNVAGQMAVRILDGEQPQNISVVKNADVWTFDWRALRRWGFKERDLPPGSIVLDRQPTLWESYKWYIIAVFSLIILESLLIAGLLWQRGRRKQAEAELRIMFERLHLAIEASSVGGWDYDLKTGKDVWFGKAHAQLGMTRDETLGSPKEFWDRVHGDDRERLEHALQVAKEKREDFGEDVRVVWRDGTTHWLRSRGRFHYAANGEAERSVGISLDITERKRAEEALLRYAAIVESSEDAIASGTLDGIIVSWNTGAQKMYGYTEAEAVGKPISMLAPPELPNEENKILEMLRAGGHIEHFETIRVTKTGKKINVSLTISPIKDASGRTVGVSGIARDISERKLAEEALRASEERLRLAQQVAHIGSFEWNIQTGVNTWTRELEAMYGLQPGTFTGTQTAFENLVHADDRAGVIKLVDRALKTGQPMEGEWRVVWADGSVHWITGRWQVFMDASGEPSKMMGVNIDVTERKLADEALAEMNRTLVAQAASLQAREELLRVFVKNVPAAVAMLDRDMRYLQVSDRWCSDNSVEASELLGHSRELSPEMPDRWKEVNRRALQGETLRADEDRWESGGSTRWARWEVRPWRAADGTVGGILILTEDITRRKQMEETLSDMSRKLIESQEQERARIGRELHDDINQRLAMLSLELEQLQENPSEVQSRVQELRNQTTELSNDVQAMSHDLHSSKLEYLGVVAGIKSWCKEFGERQRVEIDFSNDVHSALPFEIGRSLFRVLQEALHNATKHSGVKRIEVQLREDSGEIHLIIRDSGKGFDVEAALQGKGLGLTSMRERVRLVNGAISVESKPMGGTVIHVRVPFESEHVSERAV